MTNTTNKPSRSRRFLALAAAYYGRTWGTKRTAAARFMKFHRIHVQAAKVERAEMTATMARGFVTCSANPKCAGFCGAARGEACKAVR
jgi:hypothetical protein